MRIESLKLYGFRCFDSAGETIEFDGLTAFVGPNASGKTAAMTALMRLFGESREQRSVVPADFHLQVGERMKGRQERSLAIECRVTFPELDTDSTDSTTAVPESFNQMVVDEPNGSPFCRIRLDATWTDDGTIDGDIEQHLWWINTNSDDPTVIPGNRRRVGAGDRARIRVIYVPAARDPRRQIRATAGTTFGRLLEALSLGDAAHQLQIAVDQLDQILTGLVGIQTMSTGLQTTWSELYDGNAARNVALRAIEEDATSLIKSVAPAFTPAEDGSSMTSNELSDGHRSLFSLALALSLFNIEEGLREKAEESGFRGDAAEKLPSLTLFAIEEPENHLSPQYLGKIILQLKKVVATGRAQVALSSHSPAILERIGPESVRYFLGHENTATTNVRAVPLPDEETEAFKYVREAVRRNAELYFARLVVLGEGPSEEIILKRLFEAVDQPIDAHFISVVPLGGRHVNHLWRLLNGLQIPYITLLDLDREKQGGGWGRIQYVRNELITLYSDNDPRLSMPHGDTEVVRLDAPELNEIGRRSVTQTEDLARWVGSLEHYDVFFSDPLDIDFAMLGNFTEIYKSLAPANGGPRLPNEESPEFERAIAQRVNSVLGPGDETADEVGSTYSEYWQPLFAWYKYLFIDGSKPVTHTRALLEIADQALLAQAPECLMRIIARAQSLLTS
jgi:hypothetical protein